MGIWASLLDLQNPLGWAGSWAFGLGEGWGVAGFTLETGGRVGLWGSSEGRVNVWRLSIRWTIRCPKEQHREALLWGNRKSECPTQCRAPCRRLREVPVELPWGVGVQHGVFDQRTKVSAQDEESYWKAVALDSWVSLLLLEVCLISSCGCPRDGLFQACVLPRAPASPHQRLAQCFPTLGLPSRARSPYALRFLLSLPSLRTLRLFYIWGLLLCLPHVNPLQVLPTFPLQRFSECFPRFQLNSCRGFLTPLFPHSSFLPPFRH